MSDGNIPHTSSARPTPRAPAAFPARRTSVRISGETLVTRQPLSEGRVLPLTISANLPGLDLAEWVSSCRESIQKDLLVHGGILFRGFKVGTVEGFERFALAIAPELLEYRERSSPRTQIAGNIF